MGRPKKNLTTTSYVAKKVQSLAGLDDIISETDVLWGAALKRFNKISRIYGFVPIDVPLLEDRRLYENFYKDSPEDLASVVGLEAGGKAAGVRPAFLPSVLRAYYQHKIYEQIPLSKWSYSGYTVKKDAAGALKEDQEFGFEVFGNFTHLTEAQVIGAVWEFLLSLGLEDLSLEINNIGREDCQAAYQETLQGFLSSKKYDLCDACNDHLRGRALNVFRCPNLDCQAALSEAPAILDFLDQESHKHFTNILEALDELGIPYQLNPLYAGPSGHSRTNLVIKYKHKGENAVLGEGGYHESLMQNLCGKNFCCFGFAGSLKKIKGLLEDRKVTVSRQPRSDVFLVPLGELASKKSLRLFRDLTSQKISVYDHFGQAGVKNQLKQAESSKAPIALIMGQKEAVEEMVILRDIKSGMQEIISYDKIVEEVKKRLGK
ncbi:MAG: histidine--tRNA ligase family protein [Patescibacteria group bacterium]|nr:histidine--tRNA ligase family protein [Patescibacteria group bacterium]